MLRRARARAVNANKRNTAPLSVGQVDTDSFFVDSGIDGAANEAAFASVSGENSM